MSHSIVLCLCDHCSHGKGGDTAIQPGLHRDVAAEMKHEVLTCRVETFLAHYMPFSPSIEDISRARTALSNPKN